MPMGASPDCPRHRRHRRPAGGHQAPGPGPGALEPTCHYSHGAPRQSSGRWLCGAAPAPAACRAGQRSSWPPAPGSPWGDGHCLQGWPAPPLSSRPHLGFPGPRQTAETSAPRWGSFASGWGLGPGCCGWSVCWSSCWPRSRGCVGSCGCWAAGGAEEEGPQQGHMALHPVRWPPWPDAGCRGVSRGPGLGLGSEPGSPPSAVTQDSYYTLRACFLMCKADMQ